ncbi:MAG: hypothetical protein QXS42_02225 [Zestosphaera sp.]
MLRELAYMFLYAGDDKGLSTVCRIIAPLWLTALTLSSRASPNPTTYYLTPLSVLMVEFALAGYVRSWRLVLSGLRLVLLFTLVSTAIFALSTFINPPAPPIPELASGVARLVSLFLGFTLLFQLVSLREWRGVLHRIGLRRQSLIISMIMTQLPTTLMHFSEALTTVRLKYVGRRVERLVTPLTYYTVLNTRNVVEAYAQYPPSVRARLTLLKGRDLMIYTGLAVLTVVALTAP